MTKYEKTLRTIPIVSFGLLIFLFGMFIIRSYKDVNRTIEINVEARSLPVKTYQRVELDVNSFVTSREGTLYWKPDSFKEAFVLRHIADTKLSFNLIDILYLLVINCILFWMFHNVKQEDLFKKNFLVGIQIIAPLIVLYGALGMIKSLISNYFLDDITKGQFKSPSPDGFSLTPFFIAMLFLQVIPIFLKRAQKIQQEQEFTI